MNIFNDTHGLNKKTYNWYLFYFSDKFLCLTNLRTRNLCEIMQKNVLYDKRKLVTKFGV